MKFSMISLPMCVRGGILILMALLPVLGIPSAQDASLDTSAVRIIKTVADLQAVKSAAGPVILKVSASWCPACRSMKPIDSALAQAHPEVVIASIDTDTADDASKSELGAISAIPTYLFLRDGKQVSVLVGTQSRERMQAEIKKRFTTQK